MLHIYARPAPLLEHKKRRPPALHQTETGAGAALFLCSVFRNRFSRVPSRARLALKVAKGFKSRHSREAKSLTDARKSRSRVR